MKRLPDKLATTLTQKVTENIITKKITENMTDKMKS